MAMNYSFSHHHDHKLRLITGDDSRYKCSGCKMHGRGERYRCVDESCHYNLHKDCRRPDPTRTVDFLPKMVFKFLEEPSPSGSCNGGRVCNICAKPVKGFVYHCWDSGFDLHPLCANLKRKITTTNSTRDDNDDDDDDDDEEFSLREGVPKSKCKWCKNKRLHRSETSVPGFYYVGDEGKLSFHVFCLLEMGYKHGLSSVGGRSRSDQGLQKKKKNKWTFFSGKGITEKWGKVVGLFLKVVLSVLFGDPTTILASVIVHLLK